MSDLVARGAAERKEVAEPAVRADPAPPPGPQGRRFCLRLVLDGADGTRRTRTTGHYLPGLSGLPGAVRDRIRPVLAEPEFSNQRRRPGEKRRP